MSYHDPNLVTSPKSKVKNIQVIIDKGENNFSVCLLEWEGKRSVGVRWNGDSDNSIVNPQSRGIPTWFVLPEPIAKSYLEDLLKTEKGLSNLKIDKIKEFLCK